MYQQLQKDIRAGKISPVYVFCGKERFLLEDTMRLLEDTIAPGGADAFNLDKFDGNKVPLREIISSANMLPFFAQKKLIIVDNAFWFGTVKKNSGEESGEDEGKNKSDAFALEELLAYLQFPCETTCLVFLAGEKVNKTKKVTKAAVKYGVVEEFSPLKGEAAIQWLDAVLQKEGRQMQPFAKQQFLLAGDYNCAIAYQELQKLLCFVDADQVITADHVQQIVSNNTTATIFNLIDHVSAGNLEKSLATLEQVLILEPEFMIVPILANHFQTMFLSKNMKKRGFNNREIMEQSGKSHPFIIEKALRQSQKYSEEQLKKVLEILLQADRKSKTGICTARDALETAIIQICFLTAGPQAKTS